MQKPRPFRVEIIDREVARVRAEKTETERLQIGCGMWESAQEIFTRNVTVEHPEWSAEEVQREAARRMSHKT